MSKTKIATGIAILFHGCGLIGILFTPYKDWFVQHTPLNLFLMALLLIWTQPKKNISFFIFISLAFIVGMGTEMIGVHTGKLFGSYRYESILGPSLYSVPLLIGVNWFVIILCSAAVLQQVHSWFGRKTKEDEYQMPESIKILSLIIDGALLAVFFDWLMEPVAGKLGFWQWKDHIVPAYNYTCWFIISILLLAILQRFHFQKANPFAVHLFLIQSLFFLTLRMYV